MGRERQPHAVAVGAEVTGGAADQTGEVPRAEIHLRGRRALGRRDAGGEQQVLDQPRQVVAAVADDLEALVAALRGHLVAAAAQQVRVALDGGDRGAQLVRDGGDEVGLEALDLPLAGDVMDDHDVAHQLGLVEDAGVRAADHPPLAVAAEQRQLDGRLRRVGCDQVAAGGEGVDLGAVAAAGPHRAAEGGADRRDLGASGQRGQRRAPQLDQALAVEHEDPVGGLVDDGLQLAGLLGEPAQVRGAAQGDGKGGR